MVLGMRDMAVGLLTKTLGREPGNMHGDERKIKLFC